MNTSELQQASTKICEKHGTPLTVTAIDFGFANQTKQYMKFDHCEQCEKERIEIAAKIDGIVAKKNEYNMINDGIPRVFVGASLDQFIGIDPVMEWVNKPRGFLFVYGQCGCGKSHLACAVKSYFNKKKIPSKLFFSSEIFLRLRKSFGGGDETELSIISSCAPDEFIKPKERSFRDDHNSLEDLEKEYSLLINPPVRCVAIFDDIGAQKLSDYSIEAWYNIIDRRYRFGYPTLFTSNLSLKEISICMTDRIASRIASGAVFELKGNDRRLKMGEK